MMNIDLRSFAFLWGLVSCGSASAAAPDTSTAEVSLDRFQDAADLHGVPGVVLYCVSLVESRRGASPWPWTLNVRGRARYFPDRQHLLAEFRSLIHRGVLLIDVGPLQVDWRYHHDRFNGDPALAVDPWVNMNVGAQILIESLRRAGGDWKTAVGLYHSPGPSPGQKRRAETYRERVMRCIQRRNPIVITSR